MGGLADIEAHPTSPAQGLVALLNTNNSVAPASAATNTRTYIPTPTTSDGYDTLAQAQAAVTAANATSAKLANDQPVSQADYDQLTSYLNSGNYSGAWGYAAGFGNAAGVETAGANPLAGINNFANSTGNSSAYGITNETSTANPLIEDLINGGDLNTLDPSLASTWNPTTEAAYYAAATPYYNPDLLGANPYGEWGDPSKLAADGTANANAGYTPDFERFAGATPSVNGGGFLGTLADIAPYGAAAILAAASAGTLAPAIGGIAGGAAAGAAAGAGSTLSGEILSGGDPSLAAAGKGALTGAITGGIGAAAAPLTNTISEGIGDYTGLSGGTTDAIAGGLVKGGLGAAAGAGEAALTGNNVGDGAITGGVSGAASGAVGSLTGSNIAGGIAGTIAGAGAGSLLGNSGSTSLPSTPAGSSTPTTPASTALQSLPTDPNATNIGSFSGYGYAPRQQVQNPVSDYTTYGQGPEASFFQPQQTSPASASTGTVPVPTSVGSTPASTLTQNIGTQAFYPLPATSSTIQNPTSFVGGNL